MQDPEKRYHHSRSDFDQHDKDLFIEEGSLEHVYFPPHALSMALGIGALGGIVILIISIVISLANRSVFQTAARQGSNISLGTAQLILGLTCAIYLVSLAISFIDGYVVGKKAVRRLYGFYAGLLVGGIAYLGSVLVEYIPNYPGRANTSTGTSSVAGGLVVLLVTTIIWMILGALFSLWGTFVATRRHPYYLTRQAQKESVEELN